MAKHTPAPWVFSEYSTPNNDGEWPIRGNVSDDDFDDGTLMGCEEVVVARVTLQEDAPRGKGWTFGRDDDPERAANGHLIGAAPELYAAAAASIEAIDQGEPEIALVYLKAAIAKAEGGG